MLEAGAAADCSPTGHTRDGGHACRRRVAGIRTWSVTRPSPPRSIGTVWTKPNWPVMLLHRHVRGPPCAITQIRDRDSARPGRPAHTTVDAGVTTCCASSCPRPEPRPGTASSRGVSSRRFGGCRCRRDRPGNRCPRNGSTDDRQRPPKHAPHQARPCRGFAWSQTIYLSESDGSRAAVRLAFRTGRTHARHGETP